MPIVINILLAVHVLVSLFIILLVLMQRPKSEGLGAAFGGGMTDNLFGAQSTNVLQTITRWLGCLFFALSLGLSLLYAKTAQKSTIQQQLKKAAAALPQTPATPATPAAPEADPEKRLQEEIQKILEKQGAAPSPTDGLPVLPEGTVPPAKPAEPTPEAAPVPDAKPAVPAPAAPEKTPAPPAK